MVLITISHLINVLVAGGIAILLLTKAKSMLAVYGPDTPARAILTSVYLAIAITSLFALIVPTYSILIAAVLFPLQIIYKISTVYTVGMVTHPVVMSNILISVLHITSLIMLFGNVS